MKRKSLGKPGRPKNKIKAKLSSARSFFELADRLNLSLSEIIQVLDRHLDDAPSYRTIQEWRRGTHIPRFIPFGEWIKYLREETKG